MKLRKRTSRDIRSDSRRTLLHALLDVDQTTRARLSRETGLSSATVTTVVGELLSEGMVVEAGVTPNDIGRPTMSLAINAHRGRIAGIDVAETYVRAVIYDASLAELGSAEEPRDEHRSEPEYIVEGVAAAFEGALAATGTVRQDVLGIGVTLPGLVQRNGGESSVLAARPDTDPHTAQLLRERLGMQLVADNPLKAIAAAELWFGAGRTASSLVVLNLGTGVGAGVILEGRVLRGFTNSAGEWGHSFLVLDGRLCRCGRRGCVEAYVGGLGLQQTLQEVDPLHPLAQLPLQREFIAGMETALRADPPDESVLETIRRTARYLGAAIADLVAVINPERVVLTGWIAWALGDALVPITREYLRGFAPHVPEIDGQLGISTVRGNSAALGAATFALERFLGDLGLLTAP